MNLSLNELGHLYEFPYFQQMKKLYLLLLLFAAGCSLNSDQEASLNSAVTAYTTARNNGQVMTYVAFTYPDVVAYYKDKSDSSFIEKFGGSENIDSYSFIQDGNIREIKSDGNKLHVKYSFLELDDIFYGAEGSEAIIYAISEDNGQNWYFLDEVDYLNGSILKQNERLIK